MAASRSSVSSGGRPRSVRGLQRAVAHAAGEVDDADGQVVDVDLEPDAGGALRRDLDDEAGPADAAACARRRARRAGPARSAR